MNIKPIETHYAGCRFRSRLEARWAVFFDRIGARWQYEPQGFTIDGRTYLPDFLLPDCGTWVEVKGCEEDLDHGLMLSAAEHLPKQIGRGEPGPNLLILGAIPEPSDKGDWGWLGISPFDMEGGEVEVFGDWWGFGSYSKKLRPWRLQNTSTATPDCIEGGTWLTPALDQWEAGVPEAYRAARSARFEYGEKP
ncbi:hypothetical protein [Planobispora rosea]|uniref:hypothetical protein n=1 Tax=Planobispora rosea TaxID=35762 RepID=UPI00083A91E8|nr:hypothetical protein [Planobispora rosea]